MNRFWKMLSGFLALIAAIHVYEKVFGPALPSGEVQAEKKTDRTPPTWLRCSANDTDRYALGPRSRVLVTGGAGFIGSAVMARLGEPSRKRERGSAAAADDPRRGGQHDGPPGTVVGLDNFNDYYSPAYKRARAARVEGAAGFRVVEGDVCNASLLEALFAEHDFTHVIHLAAQAGVRYSLTHPLSYVRNNLECFVTLLERVRRHPTAPAFVYASSSSVYGRNRKIPFAETDPATNPANLYGASKFANEQIAAAYHHIYDLASVGLRFFTVYGPWGRPDMAAFLFTRAVELGKPLTLYNRGEMRRDFTYVDDVVDGIVASAQFCARAPAVFNLGNNRPVELLHFIETIERELGATASVVHKQSFAEIKETYADIDKARALLGYNPKTSIEEGMKRFIQWYKQEPRRHAFATGGDFNNRRRR